jgi:uncharacterized protein (DUF4415 family)
MAVRRNMTEALPPEQVAFIKGETPPAAASSIFDKPRPTSPGRSPRGRVTLTVRLESDIVAALVRASAERKIRQETPYTQQDIISEALRQWLHEASFWSEQGSL